MHLGGYGQDLPGRWDLARLINHIQGIDGIRRIRISSVDPHEVTPELLQTLQLGTVCRHLHIPLQSGSDKILRLMGRKYTAGQYEEMVARAREKTPGLAISTDIIVGFPGEEEEDFGHFDLRPANAIQPSPCLHLFPPKHTRGSAAKISPKKVKERSQRLIQLAMSCSLPFTSSSWAGLRRSWRPRQRAGLVEGLTDNYAVVVPGRMSLPAACCPSGSAAAHQDHVDGELFLMEGTKDMM